MTEKRLVCTVKTCGRCSGAQCALGVPPDTPVEKVVCPWQRAVLENAREAEQ